VLGFLSTIVDAAVFVAEFLIWAMVGLFALAVSATIAIGLPGLVFVLLAKCVDWLLCKVRGRRA
jgi:hypothetical protein